MRDRSPLRSRLRLALICCAALFAARPAHAGSVDVSLSSHYSTGDYGGDDSIDIVYVPLEIRYELGLWEVKGLLSWLRVSGGSAVVETPGGPVTTKNGTSSGFGDMILEVRRSFEPLAQLAPWITLGGRLKIPTADEDDGLGTGNVDFTPGVELAQRYGRWTPFLTVGFRILGDSNNTRYRDGFVASAGSLYRVFSTTEAGLFLDWKQAATSGSDDSLELLPMLRVGLGSDWIVDAYVSAGFTDAVPDVGTGLEIRYLLVDRP
jgi:hypothetical protein